MKACNGLILVWWQLWRVNNQCVCVYVYVCVSVYVCVYVRVYVCVCVCVCVYVYVYVSVYVCVYVRVYVPNQNPINYFTQVEQLAFCPAHLVPGIEPFLDKMLQVGGGGLCEYS